MDENVEKVSQAPPPPCWMTGRGAVLLWMLNNTQEAIKMHLHILPCLFVIIMLSQNNAVTHVNRSEIHYVSHTN